MISRCGLPPPYLMLARVLSWLALLTRSDAAKDDGGEFGQHVGDEFARHAHGWRRQGVVSGGGEEVDYDPGRLPRVPTEPGDSPTIGHLWAWPRNTEAPRGPGCGETGGGGGPVRYPKLTSRSTMIVAGYRTTA
jgi:hypothetical protein